MVICPLSIISLDMNDSDWEKLCRLCATATTNSVNIFADETKEEFSPAGEMMLDCLFSEITPNSGYPECICNYCNLQLTIFFEFKKKVMAHHAKFTEHLESQVYNIKQEEMKLKSQQGQPDNDSRKQPMDCSVEINENLMIDIGDIKSEQIAEESVGEPVSTNVKLEAAIDIDEEDYLDELYLDEEFLETEPSPAAAADDDETIEEYILDDEDNEATQTSATVSFQNEVQLEIEEQKKKRVRTRNVGEERSCLYCTEKFHNKLMYHRHMKSHGIRVTCKICQRQQFEYLLEEHMQQHEHEFHCSICGKKFFNQLSCVAHERRHSDVRPLSCEKCDKTFKAHCDLYNHMLCHNDVRKHVCTECGKAFRMRSHLTVHMESHSENTKWQCSFCDTILKTSITLREHIRQLHSFDHSHKCPHCAKGFSNKSKWRRHVETVHAGEKVKESEVECSESGYEVAKSMVIKQKRVGKRNAIQMSSKENNSAEYLEIE